MSAVRNVAKAAPGEGVALIADLAAGHAGLKRFIAAGHQVISRTLK